MTDLYTRITELCDRKGVSGYRLCKDTGLQPSFLTDLKMGRQKGISAKKAAVVADYLGVSVEYLLYGKEAEEPQRRPITEEEIRFALFDGKEVTDAKWEEVKRFVKFVQDAD